MRMTIKVLEEVSLWRPAVNTFARKIWYIFVGAEVNHFAGASSIRVIYYLVYGSMILSGTVWQERDMLCTCYLFEVI